MFRHGSRRAAGRGAHRTQALHTAAACRAESPAGSVMRGGCDQLSTVMLTPALKALLPSLNASETRAYEALGTVVVFQLLTHP